MGRKPGSSAARCSSAATWPEPRRSPAATSCTLFTPRGLPRRTASVARRGVERRHGDRARHPAGCSRGRAAWDAGIDTLAATTPDDTSAPVARGAVDAPLRVRVLLQRLSGLAGRGRRRGLAGVRRRRGLRAGQGPLRARGRGAAGRVAIVRAGLIVGPHDGVFRLPWWVRRIAAGGDVPAPGDPARELQIIDARDLAAWMLDLAEQRSPARSTAPGRPGRRRWASCSGAGDGLRRRLRWIPDAALRAPSVEPWTELPLWAPGTRCAGPGGSAPSGAGGRPALPPAPRRSRTSPPGCATAARRS